MKTKAVTLFWVILLTFPSIVNAQSDISMCTHWYNRTNYNPAFITRSDYMYIFGNTRKQWWGVDGAPTVENLQVTNYFSRYNSAIGLSITGDQIGVTQVLNPMLHYAYKLELKHSSLSFGISGGLYYRTIDGSQYQADTDNDSYVNYSTESQIKPDMNLGIEWQNKHWIAGLSSTHLLSLQRTDSLFLNTNHRYGYLIYKNDSPILFNYSLGLQVVNRENLTVFELNGLLRFKQNGNSYSLTRETFDLGLTLRSTKQITLLAGINITPNLKLGYAYDQTLFSGYAQNGTHELMLEYRIPNNAAETPSCKYSGWYR